jgi:hypothetical protein
MVGLVVLGEHTKEIVKIQYIKKNNMMFKEGDKYIHFSKYGSINKGEVKSCGSTTVIDSFRCVTYKQYHIISTKGILLNLDGTDGRVYKVEDEFTPEEGENFINLMTKAKEIKSKRIEELHRNGVEL